MNEALYKKATSNVPEFSVGEISQALKRVVETTFERVRVRGEISGLSRPASGHVYFKMKDSDAVIDAVIWKGNSFRLPLKPEDGMEIVATGKISTYPGNSRYQIIIETLELAGQGALLKLLEDRKKKLAAEGLFDPARKIPVPFLPRVIGVITSPSGAVIRDIIHRIEGRFPLPVIVWPVPVQGEGAAELIAAAIKGMDELAEGGAVPKPDLIIVARGGGSIEDLWSFNEEIVVRAAAACKTPLISAVGHETDFTLIDFAADVRAPTPTAAAEMAVPVRLDLLDAVAAWEERLSAAMARLIADRRKHVTSLSRALISPVQQLRFLTQKLQDKAQHLEQAMRNLLWQSRLRLERASGKLKPELLKNDIGLMQHRLKTLEARMQQAALSRLKLERQNLAASARMLENLSYERVLDRGFSLITKPSGEAVTKAALLQAGDAVEIRFADGVADADIRKVGVKPKK